MTGSLWRSRSFLLLWGGQTAGEVGARISGVAVPLLAATVLHASVFQVSVLAVLGWVPYLIVSLPAGVLADRVDRRRLMIGCDLGRAVLLLALPVGALTGHLTLVLLYAVVTLTGVLTVFFTVAYRTELPGLVGPERLVDANAKVTMSQELAELAGPALAGALVGLAGAARTFFVNSVTYLISAMALALIRAPARERVAAERVGLRQAIAEGLSFVRRDAILVKLLACTAVSNFFVMATHGVDVVFLTRELGASAVQVGLVFSLGAVGGVLAGTVADRLTRWVGTARTIWVSMVVPGPLYLLIPAAQPGWGLLLFAAGFAAFGANAMLYNVSALSYRQRITPPPLLGRVNASFLWISYGSIPLGALAGGALGSAFGLRPALLIAVLGMWSASLFVVFSPLRGLRDFPAAATRSDDAPGDQRRGQQREREAGRRD
ncbi:MFS transporter [Actinoplanes friuliensis]|uniref:Major facilitator superfamily protein n=1 Tax=Actinoplanes friuliensis DSM 7358 TaxID=1246995 RepID=U5VYZ0_9ACTN|nr:MFS transporter [Actinoplanes friuliensis]AGZ42069.1 major facilitator superfamily protein [Actinoplanes friuliensis DSM 7358]